MTEEDKYIIITNFDFWNGDFREYLDWTGGHIGSPRRIFAENFLNTVSTITPEILMDTLDMDGVFAINSTIWNGVWNVETGYWNGKAPFPIDYEKAPRQ